MFQAVELVSDAPSRHPLDDAQKSILQEVVPKALLEAGVICRAFHRGAPVLQFAPTLISTEEELADLVAIVRAVLIDALDLLEAGGSGPAKGAP
jgi:adenosylmethionine-8-amino-7-oxononanoate aminotransferase